ncbi:MAG TPA: chemotaxis protein CheW [Syntrophobacteraceae bacterium]|nr:chemotaxis protein CheW [Syntrophobacteraceae bacterium]
MGAAASLEIQEHVLKGKEGKYLTFALSEEEYGVEILKIREIIGMMDVTTVPQMPHYVKGVINLRGKVIPVIDLRLRFGLDSKAYDDRTCIIVAEVRSDNTSVQMGLVVDTVSEVVNIGLEDMEHTPVFGVNVDTHYILGMAKLKGKVKILLDIDKVLTETQWQQISKAV